MQQSLTLEPETSIPRITKPRWSSEDLFEEYFEPIHSYFSRRVNSAEDVNDLTAETFASTVGTKIPRGVEPLSWLYGISRRKLADHLRRQKRSGFVPTEVAPTAISERALMIRDWVDALPSDQREALLLQALEGLSVNQIAVVMHRSPKSVKALLQRAKESVRNQSRMEFEMEENR